jgi:archaemetzincin
MSALQIQNRIKFSLLLVCFIFIFPVVIYAQSIVVVPMGKIDDKLVEQTVQKLKESGMQVTLSKKESMPTGSYYVPRKRYRADNIIASLRKRAAKNEVYLALTSQDISTSVHNQKDFGVMGLGYVPGNASVVSSFRIKNKNFLYRIALHEIGHNKGIDHCPSKNCFMMDAEKKDRTSEMLLFCDKCKKKWN